MVTTSKPSSLTHKRLLELLSYQPETGEFKWQAKANRRVRIGDVAGCLRSDGYLLVGIDGRTYRANRLAIFYVTGAWPRGVVDHFDGDTQNNALSNLRDVSVRINVENRHIANRVKRSGLPLGVFRARRGDRVTAKIAVAGKSVSLGTFATAEEAAEAYRTAKRRLHSKTHFTNQASKSA